MMSYIGKGSCWDLHWVFKPRQASMRPVVSHIKFSYKINSVWDLCRTALWWQRIISILCQCRRDCLVCWLVCVCVLPGKAAEQQQDCLFPHIWWQRWDRETQNPKRSPSERRARKTIEGYKLFYYNQCLIFIIVKICVCFTVCFFVLCSGCRASCSSVVQLATLGEHD